MTACEQSVSLCARACSRPARQHTDNLARRALLSAQKLRGWWPIGIDRHLCKRGTSWLQRDAANAAQKLIARSVRHVLAENLCHFSIIAMDRQVESRHAEWVAWIAAEEHERAAAWQHATICDPLPGLEAALIQASARLLKGGCSSKEGLQKWFAAPCSSHNLVTRVRFWVQA